MHGPSGEIIIGTDAPSTTLPDFPDVAPVMEPLVGTTGKPITAPGTGHPVLIDVAGIAAAEEAWIADGGDPTTNPPPSVRDDEWFDQPTNHPLDPRWYKAIAAE